MSDEVIIRRGPPGYLRAFIYSLMLHATLVGALTAGIWLPGLGEHFTILRAVALTFVPEGQKKSGETQKKAETPVAEIIQRQVQRYWDPLPTIPTGLSCTVFVKLTLRGEVVDVQIIRSSGNALFDRSVESAVRKASPIEVPPDTPVVNGFREFTFEFKPGG